MTKPQYQVLETSHRPDVSVDVIFAPLVHLVGEDNTGQYMFMAQERCYSLGKEVVIRCYKHSTTRNYVNIDASGNFYVPVKARHNTDEYAYEPLDIQKGICTLIDNALAYHKEGEMLKNLTLASND